MVGDSSVLFCLPVFFTIIFSPSSRSDSFYWLSFFQNQLRDIIARRCAMRFPAKKSLLSPTPRVHADYFPLPGKSVRTEVRYVITKFSGMDSLPNFITHGAPLIMLLLYFTLLHNEHTNRTAAFCTRWSLLRFVAATPYSRLLQ